MTSSNPEPPKPHFVSISGHMGGPDTSLTNSLLTQLSNLFVKHCKVPYSEKIRHISFFVEVGGMITDFNRLTTSVKLGKDGMLAIDLVVPAAYHRDRPVAAVKATLFNLFVEAIEAAVSRLAKARNLDFDLERFNNELGAALAEFIVSWEVPQPSAADIQIHRGFARLLELRKLASALGKQPPRLPLPSGWTIIQDPRDPERVLFRRTDES